METPSDSPGPDAGRKMARHIVRVAVMAALCLGQSAPASGETRPATAALPVGSAGPVEPRLLWQIGEFDNNFLDLIPSTGHFARTMPFPAEVILRPGTDSPAVVWPAIHPAPMDDWAGSKRHPFTVLFDLPDEPRGTFVLKMDLLGIHAWFPPIIEVELNGQRGSIVLPKTQTDYGVVYDSARGREHIVEVEIAAGAFVRRAQPVGHHRRQRGLDRVRRPELGERPRR